MPVETFAWDTSQHLDSPEIIEEYLRESFEGNDIEQLKMALANVAKAKGMTKIAEEAGVTRASLYKSLSGDTSPKFETISKVLNALGLKMTITHCQEEREGGGRKILFSGQVQNHRRNEIRVSM